MQPSKKEVLLPQVPSSKIIKSSEKAKFGPEIQLSFWEPWLLWKDKLFMNIWRKCKSWPVFTVNNQKKAKESFWTAACSEIDWACKSLLNISSMFKTLATVRLINNSSSREFSWSKSLNTQKFQKIMSPTLTICHHFLENLTLEFTMKRSRELQQR